MRLIDADALMEKQYESEGYCGLSTMVVDVRDIEDAPTIEAPPVRTGEWILLPEESYGTADKQCSLCHENSMIWSNYCPNCGARMDGKVHNP